MNALSNLSKRIIRKGAHQSDLMSNKPDAWVGAVIGGKNTIPGSRGGPWIWVTLAKGNERGAPAQVINRTVTPNWGTPVKLFKNDQGKMEVKDVATSSIDAFNNNSPYSSKVGLHSHEEGQGLYDLVHIKRIFDLKVLYRGTDGDYTVWINAGFYYDNTGTRQWWPGGTLDLRDPIDYRPAAPGTHQWIMIGLELATGLPKAVAGPPVAVGTMLSDSDLADIAFGTDLALSAVDIFNGRIIQGEGDFTDCSYVRLPPPQAFSAEYQTVQVDGTPMTQRGILNLKSGSNVTLTATDDPGGDRSEVSIASSGGGGSTFYDARNVPGSPSAYDDEFDSAVASGLWTLVNWAGLTSYDYDTSKPSAVWAHDAPTAWNLRALLQTIPVGDFTCFCQISASMEYADNYFGGLCLADGTTPGTGNQLSWGPSWDSFNYMELHGWSAWSPTGFNAKVHPFMQNSYLRIRRIGTTGYFSSSIDGATWSPDYSTSITGYTKFGLCVATANSQPYSETSWDFFRYYNNTTIQTLGL